MEFSAAIPWLASAALAIIGFFLRGLAVTIKELSASVGELKTEVAVLSATRVDHKGLEERVRALEMKE